MNLSTMGEEHVRGDKLHPNTACRCTFSCSLTADLKGNWHVRTSQRQARKVQVSLRKIVPVAWIRAAQFCAYTWQEPEANEHPSLIR